MIRPAPRNVAVIDIGKTNAKLALVDLTDGKELAVVMRPNTPMEGPPYRHFDTDGTWVFVLNGLQDFQRRFGIDGIAVTTHGASVVLLDSEGGLAAPILDYEDPGPEELRVEYDRLRPDFADTGSPPSAGGLSIGAQIHWQFACDPGLAARTATVITYPGYWAFRLTGVQACDVTSLGCHSDLWLPGQGMLSPLCDRLGIADKVAPAMRPDTVLGPVLPDIAADCGLGADTPVVCGIHDSNASLYPHLLGRAAPFAVVSTGTWVIAMAVGGDTVKLDPADELMMNVNALGDPVPSARFMGGRTFDVLTGAKQVFPHAVAIRGVVNGQIMVFPDPGETGPVAARTPLWKREPAHGTAERTVAVSFHLALLCAHSLAQIGARGPVIVEGAFARNTSFLSMLATACGRSVEATESATGTSLGAALLFAPDLPVRTAPSTVHPDPALSGYATAWRTAAGLAH